MSFILHERIEADSAFVTDLELCQVRLLNNATYPWLLLIPRQNDIKETIDLSEPDQLTLMKEIGVASKIMQNLYNPDKLNVAGIGNMVPQLHMHVIARFKTDPVWPHPVWGQGGDQYTDDIMIETINTLKKAFSND